METKFVFKISLQNNFTQDIRVRICDQRNTELTKYIAAKIYVETQSRKHNYAIIPAKEAAEFNMISDQSLHFPLYAIVCKNETIDDISTPYYSYPIKPNDMTGGTLVIQNKQRMKLSPPVEEKSAERAVRRTSSECEFELIITQNSHEYSPEQMNKRISGIRMKINDEPS